MIDMKRVMPGISFLSMALAVVTFTAVIESTSMSYGKHTRLYADSSVNQAAVSGVESGLLGMISGLEKLQEYEKKSQSMEVLLPGESAVAGASKVDRDACNRHMAASYSSSAAEIGYDALMTIRENQLPYDEYYTLLQIVEAEATGGSIESKMMIANVVLNRVKDEHFPDSISEVVWQNEGGTPQFTPTVDGRIYSCEITSSTVEAVERALDGENNAGNALFFVARKSADTHNVKWFDASLVKLFEYGGHEFYTFGEQQ